MVVVKNGNVFICITWNACIFSTKHTTRNCKVTACVKMVCLHFSAVGNDSARLEYQKEL